MKLLYTFAKWLAAAGSIAAVLLLASLLVHASWTSATRKTGQLRWAIVAREPIPAGRQIAAEMIRRTFHRSGLDRAQIATEEDILNRYARVTIEPDRIITRSDVGAAQWASRNMEMFVPVSVRAELAVGLHAGTRIALTRIDENETGDAEKKDKTTKTLGLAISNDTAARTPPVTQGYEIVSKFEDRSGAEPKAVLVVRVPRESEEDAAELSNGTWGVIGLPSPKGAR